MKWFLGGLPGSEISVRRVLYLRIPSRKAREGSIPDFCEEKIRSVRSLSVWALPSKPPNFAVRWLSVRSPAWPKGGWPRSWERQTASMRSGSIWKSSERMDSGMNLSHCEMALPICATSSECVRRVR